MYQVIELKLQIKKKTPRGIKYLGLIQNENRATEKSVAFYIHYDILIEHIIISLIYFLKFMICVTRIISFKKINFKANIES